MSNALKFLRPIGIAMFVILVGPLFQSDFRASAQTCFTCSFACPFGSGFYCEPNGPQGGGAEPCLRQATDVLVAGDMLPRTYWLRVTCCRPTVRSTSA